MGTQTWVIGHLRQQGGLQHTAGYADEKELEIILPEEIKLKVVTPTING